ncbi:hypothetical protein NEF87_003426 [Candidatus Lokiarchaeum ossiferum]|uniref:Uncharacterized protein n=1 Tax=Candidatus Lokiarchaeum ossiferum TaxID=2951803 RepID=A0ABY6HUD9_9ARCH|nr:hypothetical protein NEF87_003426 [Candidatus Lokiarchaeum sp. B-35]
MKTNPQTILLEKLEHFFTTESNKILSSHEVCQNCKKSCLSSQLKIFRFEFIPLNASRHMLKQLSNRQKQRMLVKNGNTFELNHKDMFVVRIKNLFLNARYQVLCNSCFSIARHQFEWDILVNPSSTDKELKEVIRNLIKKGSNSDILELCELLTPNISNRMRKIPRHVRHIWLLFSYFAKRLFQHPVAQPHVKAWMQKWMGFLAESNFISSQIGISISKSIFAIDDKSLSNHFFSILYSSEMNYFKFFRLNGEMYFNHAISAYLVEFQEESKISPRQMEDTLRGLIAGGNPKQIEILLEKFPQFSKQYQEIIMEDLFFFGFRKNFTPLLDQLLKKVDLVEDPIIKNDLYSIYTKLKKNLSDLETTRQKTLDEQNRMNDLEQKRIKMLHQEWMKKSGPSPNQMASISSELITKVYNPVIEAHIQTYREDLELFFTTHTKPVIAFDNEEFHNRVFCILGVVIYPDLSYSVKLISVDDIYPINDSHRELMDEMKTWLKSFPSSQVISHGTNQAEGQIIKDGGHFQINTQDVLHAAKYFNNHYAHHLKGEGLKHFEKMIEFERKACPVLKHEMSGSTFFNLAEVSMDQLLCEQPLSVCGICHREQDVLLYCLEDAFSSLLIYIIFSNKEPILCKNLGYELLK